MQNVAHRFKYKLKKGDQVIVLAGKYKGKIGEILQVRADARVKVLGVNIIKKHVKPNPQKNQEGGIVEREAPLHISNVAIYNPITKKADRVGYKSLEDGRKVRYFKSTKEVIDV